MCLNSFWRIQSFGYVMHFSRAEKLLGREVTGSLFDEKSTHLFYSDLVHVLIVVLVCITIDKNNSNFSNGLANTG